MKNILFIIFLVALSLSLSLSALALGNDYTFSDPWNKLVFNYTQFLSSSSSSQADLVTGGLLQFSSGDNNLEIGASDSLSFAGASYQGDRSSSFDISIPVDIRIENQYLTWDLYFLSTARDVTFTVNGITSSSTFALPFDVVQFEDAKLQNLVYNQNGGISSVSDVYTSGYCHKITIEYNATSFTRLNSINIGVVIDYPTSGITSFLLGTFGSTSLTSVPDEVIESISFIASQIRTMNNRIVTLINEVRAISSKLDELTESIGSNGSVTTNYYNQILNPSEDQQDALTEIDEMLSSAKEELAEIKEVINSVQAPTSEDLTEVNDVGSSSALNVIESEDTQQLFSSIFGKLDFLTGIILSVLAIATLGYVLFGKKV